MGTITSAKFEGTANPKNQIRINGLGLKPNASEGDVELLQSILGAGHPVMVTISDTIICIVGAGLYTSNMPGVTVRMKGADGNWTNQVAVST